MSEPADAAMQARAHSDDGGGPFRLLFEHALHYLAMLSPTGTVLAANRTLLSLSGLTPEQVVGRPFWECGWWHADAAAVERLRELVAGAAAGTAMGHELEALDRNGRGVILDLSIAPIRGAHGGVVQLVAEAVDVTEAKWSERALRISEAKFAGIVSIASDAIISIDESQSILHFNRGAEQIFGWTAEEVLGKPIDLLIPPRFHEVHREHIRNFGRSAVAARRMGERAEILGIRKSGVEFPADASISKLEIGGERIYTVVLRDVTDRKRRESGQEFLARAGELLAASLDYETTLRSVVRLAVPTLAEWAVLYVARDGGLARLELVHADATKEPLLTALASYPLASMPAHPVFTAVATAEPLLIAQVGDELLETMTADPAHRQIFRDLGFRSLMMVPLVARGRTLGAVGFYAAGRTFDAADLVLAQELAVRAALALDNAQLYRATQHAVQARDDVLAVVSHDLGNPLSAILIGTKVVRRRLPEHEADALKQVDGIRQAAEQMERLIRDLLDVKRLEAGQLTLQRRSQRAASLLAEVMDMIGSLAEERGQTLVCDVDEALPPISVDRARGLQVLQNLLGNAIKFTPAGGRITLRAERYEGAARFAVSDTGPGIPEEHLPLIFDRFWQARREGRLGLGLGLAIAKGIIDAHGGRIWADSRIGAGTTVYFTLPLAAASDST